MTTTTFFCVPPQCDYTQFDTSSLGGASSSTDQAVTTATSQSVNLIPEAISGSGSTWGTAEDGSLPGTWNVAPGATVTIAAGLQNDQNWLRAGFLYGQFGSSFYEFAAPFFGSDAGNETVSNYNTYSPGDNISSRVLDAATSPYGALYDWTQGHYIASVTFSSAETDTPRTNESVAAISLCTTCTVNNNGGYWLHGYYQPANSTSLDAWGAYTVQSASPYTVDRLNSQNWFAIPLLN
ncbi:MAG: hypothetical protein ACYDC5_13430 [Candidatus Dormibacteria bacterium]